MLSTFKKLVTEYSNRHLTVHGDILHAVTGTIRYLEAHYTNIEDSMSLDPDSLCDVQVAVCLKGFWGIPFLVSSIREPKIQRSLHHHSIPSLSWTSRDARSAGRRPGFPSWSWIGRAAWLTMNLSLWVLEVSSWKTFSEVAGSKVSASERWNAGLQQNISMKNQKPFIYLNIVILPPDFLQHRTSSPWGIDTDYYAYNSNGDNFQWSIMPLYPAELEMSGVCNTKRPLTPSQVSDIVEEVKCSVLVMVLIRDDVFYEYETITILPIRKTSDCHERVGVIKIFCVPYDMKNYGPENHSMRLALELMSSMVDLEKKTWVCLE